MKLIVGLGNLAPYQFARHNVGEWFIRELAEKHNAVFKTDEHCAIAEYDDVLLLFPHTMMNDSGIAVQHIMKKYNIQEQDVLIVHDELDLDIGKYKFGKNLRHNGVKSTNSVGEFKYLRIGIGKQKPILEYVLSEPTAEEKQKILETISIILVDY